jgi:ribosomal protein L12E/L44/L45/RPP1/RPP2
MEYIYAAMLLHNAGKPVDEESVTKVLSAAGLNVDASRVKALVASLSEVDIDEAIKSAAFMPARKKRKRRRKKKLWRGLARYSASRQKSVVYFSFLFP